MLPVLPNQQKEMLLSSSLVHNFSVQSKAQCSNFPYLSLVCSLQIDVIVEWFIDVHNLIMLNT